jgi:hypothetical protein
VRRPAQTQGVMSGPAITPGKQAALFLVYANAAVAFVAATYLFIIPFCALVQALRDPGLSSDAVPRVAFRAHRSLTDRYEAWARDRVASGRASQLSTSDFSGTEWPLFSSVFYLWTTEALQEAWEKDPSLTPVMPSQYARGAIEAAAALVADPNHAAWVKKHWGDDYLHQENVFYRMLLISGLTSYQQLLGDGKYQLQLRDQVETLAKEFDDSPFGLLDDYPGECYPIDILPAIAAIQRAGKVLGTDHSAFINRALRAFEGSRLDSQTQLPAYVADSKTGQGYGSARGVGASFMLIWAPEIWPETARQWFSRYENLFWREGALLVGFREYPKGHPNSDKWLADVDAGPVMAGYGTGASAFGIGATRVNGDFEKAYPLSALALVVSWPLPDGTLLGPRLLSNYSDAPYVGEAALLFSLTRRSIVNGQATTGRLPFSVYILMSVYVIVALAWIRTAAVRVSKWKKTLSQNDVPAPGWQLGIWLALVVSAVMAWILSWGVASAVLLLVSQFLPRAKRST